MTKIADESNFFEAGVAMLADCEFSLPVTKERVSFLVGQFDSEGGTRLIPVHTTPFTIGRRPGLSLTLPSATVSGLHAEIARRGEDLVLRDLGSTNGTWVNGKRIEEPTRLNPDDLIQFADVLFRLRCQYAVVDSRTLQEDVCDQALALVQFDKLMNDRSVTPHYQPIVNLQNEQTIGFEVLARSKLFGLETPQAMFRAAGQLRLEVELSQMLRWEGMVSSRVFGPNACLFLNTDPAETGLPGLLESMHALRRLHPTQPLVLEIHEAAITNPQWMRELRHGLVDLNIGLAYDDFGAGQTRLVELSEVRPDYLKFDIGLVRGLHEATPERRKMLKSLVDMALELDVAPLAEGIESPEECQACRDIGFKFGQGYFLGRPAPAPRSMPGNS